MNTQSQWVEQNKPLLKALEVAEILNISRALAYRLISNGDIPAIRINHSVRVRSEDLQEYIQCRWSGWKD